MNKAVTINDVALHAGVSVSTASKALCGKGRMGDDTRTRIIEVAKTLGYKPNRAAQALSRKTVNIAALLPDSPKQVQSILREGLEDAFRDLASFNLSYQIHEYPETPELTEVRELIKSLSGQIDALIIEGDASLADAVSSYHPGIPVITLVTGAEPFNAVTSVLIDAETSGRLAAQFLAVCGAHRTVIMAGRKSAYIHNQNIVGYQEAAAQFGLETAHVYYTEDCWETAARYTEDAITRFEGLDGIFVSSYLAPSVCQYLKKHGLVGKIKVIGVDVYEEIIDCLNDGSLLATLYQNQYLQARSAADTMLDCISTGVRMLPPVRMKPELVMLSNLQNYR